jgi:hypothetical protein
MSNTNYYFKGNVRVYLQGLETLEIYLQSEGLYSYHLGSPRSKIRIRDFRRLSRDAACHALNGENIYEFADVFNQPALAKIREKNGKIRIDMHECTVDTPNPILWLGVVKDGNTIPLHIVRWEKFKAIEKNSQLS